MKGCQLPPEVMDGGVHSIKFSMPSHSRRRCRTQMPQLGGPGWDDVYLMALNGKLNHGFIQRHM